MGHQFLKPSLSETVDRYVLEAADETTPLSMLNSTAFLAVKLIAHDPENDDWIQHVEDIRIKLQNFDVTSRRLTAKVVGNDVAGVRILKRILTITLGEYNEENPPFLPIESIEGLEIDSRIPTVAEDWINLDEEARVA